MSKHETEQENFWAGDFGNQYISRNEGDLLLASNLNFLNSCLKRAGKVNSCREFGANIGMNLKALKLLYPGIELKGIELNSDASKELKKLIGDKNVFHGSIFEADVQLKVELSLIKGVLIHINPDKLQLVYQKLYESSSKYILIAEYYNPVPVSIPYRGHQDRLFKRDFAGEIMDRHPQMKLVDYGFVYHRDSNHPQDDLTWFLLEKG